MGIKRRWRSQRWISDWHAGCTVTLERTIRERVARPAALEEGTGAKQQLVVSRSFGSRVTQLAQMQQAVTKYAWAGEKLRQENRLAKVVTVFIQQCL